MSQYHFTLPLPSLTEWMGGSCRHAGTLSSSKSVPSSSWPPEMTPLQASLGLSARSFLSYPASPPLPLWLAEPPVLASLDFSCVLQPLQWTLDVVIFAPWHFPQLCPSGPACLPDPLIVWPYVWATLYQNSLNCSPYF